MFDLETAIVNWREQMLAAGIKTPEPLEELENHLREEIQQQVKLGLSEAEALTSAKQKIGQMLLLQNEFQKVEAENRMRRLVRQICRSIGLVLGWLLLSAIMFWRGNFDLYMHWNFFSFTPVWDRETFFDVFIILIGETGIWFLAKASHDKASRVVSLLVCLLFVAIAIFGVLPAEPIRGGFLGRDKSSPLWFRGSCALLLCLPGLFWLWWERRQVVKDWTSAQKTDTAK